MHTPAYNDVVSCAEIAAAAAVLNENGIDIKLPWEGSLDDLERERYEALCLALMAAIRMRGKPDEIAKYTEAIANSRRADG